MSLDMNLRRLIKSEFFIVSIILILFFIFNFFWIFNYADDYNSEDMILIGHAMNMIPKLDNLNGIYYYKSQPLYPYLLANWMTITSDEYIPYYIENIFLAISGVLLFLIIKRLYSGKIGIYALIIFLLFPGILQYSRTIYGISLVMAFLLLSTRLSQFPL